MGVFFGWLVGWLVFLAFKGGGSVVKTSQLSLPFVLAVTCISRKVSEPAANKEEMDGKSKTGEFELTG